MRTLRALALTSVLGLTLVACGSDGAATSDTTAPVVGTDTTAAPETTAGSDTTAGTETTTDDDGTTTTGSVQSGPVQIDVLVGTDSGEDRIEQVTAGSEITLNITNPNADDEFHVHGIDFEQAAAKGEMATMNFTLAEPGTYEVESHVTTDVLLIITVS